MCSSDLIAQTSELNTTATSYGLSGPGSFMRFLNADVEEREKQKRAKVEEEARAAMSVSQSVTL